MSSKKAPDLPGFYFDEERNRYFRLLPENSGVHPVTGEGIKKKQRRKNKKKNCFHQNVTKSRAPKRELRQQNVCNFICKKQIKSFSPLFYQHHVISSKCRCFGPGMMFTGFSPMLRGNQVDWQYKPEVAIPSLDSSQMLLVSNEAGFKALSKVEKIDVSTTSASLQSISTSPASYICDISYQEFSQSGNAYGGGVLMAAVCGFNESAVIYINQTFSAVRVIYPAAMPEACALHRQHSMMTYSVESDLAYIEDIERHFSTSAEVRTTGAQHISMGSRISSLSFSIYKKYLYCGFLDGKMFGLDCRTNMHMCKHERLSYDLKGYFKGKLEVILPLSDERRLITRHISAKDDQIQLWDIRYDTKPLLRYKYNYDQSLLGGRAIKGKMKAFVDPCERILSCTGSDDALHLWDLSTGQHLCHVNGTMGSYSDSWNLLDGRPGIFGIQDGFIAYLPFRCE
ncbi:uncharacterized protein LOC143468443 [Clavelina lepadiformis]|uniref:uncharacterized protein LOC143468443 n=1 Tax=Clavelina lepadiformis TaxID=159417 RepID=UPI0040426A52